MEMIKGIQGHGYYDELVIPIIENTAHERELTDSLAEAVCSVYLGYFQVCNLELNCGFSMILTKSKRKRKKKSTWNLSNE